MKHTQAVNTLLYRNNNGLIQTANLTLQICRDDLGKGFIKVLLFVTSISNLDLI